MTILTWHEQRLNKIDETLKNFEGAPEIQAEVVREQLVVDLTEAKLKNLTNNIINATLCGTAPAMEAALRHGQGRCCAC